MKVGGLIYLIACSLLPPPASQAGGDKSYAAIVEQYRVAPEDASSRMLAMAPQELERAIKAAVAPDSGWTVDALDAALLMHTDAAVFLTRERDPDAWRQVEWADSLGLAAARDAENTWFVHRWYSAITRAFPHDQRIKPIRERWEHQPWRRSALALERALWLETDGASEPSVRFPLLDSNLYGPEQFRHALELFQKALSGGMTGAALHLGRIQMLLGKEKEARSLFTTAAGQSRSANTRYLARLFLGSMDELEGHPDVAERQYLAALEEVPHAQSGRLALAALLARSGRSIEAAGVIADRAPDESQRPSFDPWSLYLPAHSDEFGVLMGMLYAEVRR